MDIAFTIDLKLTAAILGIIVSFVIGFYVGASWVSDKVMEGFWR